MEWMNEMNWWNGMEWNGMNRMGMELHGLEWNWMECMEMNVIHTAAILKIQNTHLGHIFTAASLQRSL